MTSGNKKDASGGSNIVPLHPAKSDKPDKPDKRAKKSAEEHSREETEQKLGLSDWMEDFLDRHPDGLEDIESGSNAAIEDEIALAAPALRVTAKQLRWLLRRKSSLGQRLKELRERIKEKKIADFVEDILNRNDDHFDEIDARRADDEQDEEAPLQSEADAIFKAEVTRASKEFEISEEELRKRIKDAFLKRPNRQSARDIYGSDIKTYGRFKVSSLGVWANVTDKGLLGLYSWRRISKTRIDPLATSTDLNNDHWRTRFVITHKNREEKQIDIPRELIGHPATQAIRRFRRCGAQLVTSTKQHRDLLAAFFGQTRRAQIKRAPQTGWLQRGHVNLFVLPDVTLGQPDSGPRYELDGAEPGGAYGFQIAGSVGDWGKHIAQRVEGNSNVALSVGVFVASPLLKFAGEPGGGFHLSTKSKEGKSLAAAIGQSVYGIPFSENQDSDVEPFGISWRGTEGSIEQSASLRNDAGLYLDELRKADPKVLVRLSYQLAGGEIKKRLKSNTSLRRQPKYRLLILSSGEMTMREFCEEKKAGDKMEGYTVRIADVPAQVQPGSVFETISHDGLAAAGKTFYRPLYYGAVGRAWLEHLVKLGPAKIKDEINRHRNAWDLIPEIVQIRENAHPQVETVVNRFRLLAVALRMAIEAKLVPWSIDNADQGIIACMVRWSEQRGNLKVAGETLRAFQQFKTALVDGLEERFICQQRNAKSFVPVQDSDRRKLVKWNEMRGADMKCDEIDGVIRDKRIHLTAWAWTRLWGSKKKEEMAEIIKHLTKTGFLLPGKDAPAQTVKFEGRPERMYVIPLEMVTDSAESEPDESEDESEPAKSRKPRAKARKTKTLKDLAKSLREKAKRRIGKTNRKTTRKTPRR